MGADRSITLTWSAAPNATIYDVQVFPSGTPAGQECTATATFCATAQLGTAFTFTVPAGRSNYLWRVRAGNALCTPTYGAWAEGSFTPVGALSGTMYLDNTMTAGMNLATGLCERTGTNTAQSPGTATVSATWSGAGSPKSGPTSGSSFSLPDVPNMPTLGLTLSLDPTTTWRCTCPSGCTYGGIQSPQSGIPYFVTTAAGSWWQARGGLIYAGNTSMYAIVSRVPSTAGANAYLNRRGTASLANSSGICITGGGDIDSTPEMAHQYVRLREDTAQVRIIGSEYKGPKENYTYFYSLYSMGISPSSDFSGSKPTSAPLNGRAYYGTGSVSATSSWNVEDGESYVIFVNGSLTISNTITVQRGGFLAFIVSGDIIFSNTLGTGANNTIPVVEGVFIADRIIVQGGRSGGDLKFVGAGTFVGWSSVLLQRQYSVPLYNSSYPTELFIHRPDFVVNTPERMKRPLQVWQEVN